MRDRRTCTRRHRQHNFHHRRDLSRATPACGLQCRIPCCSRRCRSAAGCTCCHCQHTFRHILSSSRTAPACGLQCRNPCRKCQKEGSEHWFRGDRPERLANFTAIAAIVAICHVRRDITRCIPLWLYTLSPVPRCQRVGSASESMPK